LACRDRIRASHLKKNDKAAFKTHITEAFWLSPRQAAAFAPHIERMRLEESMRTVKVDFSIRLKPVSSGDPVELTTLMKDQKAMLLHFWSPWSRECESSLPDFLTTVTSLAEKGISAVSLISDDSPKLLTDARAMLQPLGQKPPGAWLIDSKESPLSRDLRVQTLPQVALISNEGLVLYNGDPTEDGFWDALQKINPLITRPEILEVSE
jgi:hypothetical protein